MSFEYDVAGNRTKIIDPDGGTVSTLYDAFGNVRSETAPSGATTFDYDTYGRLVSRTAPDGTTTYAYVATGADGSGQIAAVNHSSGASQTYTYDRFGRMTSNTETFEGTGYTYSNTYDNLGRISAVNYPSGVGYRNIFDANGFLKQINDETGTMLWHLDNTNVMGQITSVSAGSGKTTVRGYDAFHFPQSVVTGSFQNNTYSFQKENGNLLSRTDNIFGLSESFHYDAADRLEKNTFNATELVTAYDVSGNITAKTDVGTNYLYNSPKPHAVTGISNATANIPALQQNLTYTSFDKVQKITEGSHTLDFYYGIDRQRRKTVLKNGSEILKTKYFFGNYEKEITSAGTRELNTIPGFDGNYALIVKDNNGQRNIYYIYTDHLGSTNIVSDAAGNPVERHNFDAWGRERNPQTWEYSINNNQSSIVNGRGYTGHEILPEFSLINMNGRLYDPVLGRMLSPDPFVQAPGNSQNYNRYSYVLNNPLKFTDPSGYWWGWDDAIVAGGGFVLGYVGYGLQTDDWGWKAVGAGALSAVAIWVGYNTAGLSGSISSHTWNYLATSAVNTALNTYVEPMTFNVNQNVSVSVSPSFFYSTHGFQGGLTAGVHYQKDNIGISVYGTAVYGEGFVSGNQGGEYRGGVQFRYSEGKNTYSFGINRFQSGETSQFDWVVGLQFDEWSIAVEEDYKFSDKYRTGAFHLGYKYIDEMEFTADFKAYTGNAPDSDGKGTRFSQGRNTRVYTSQEAYKYLAGILSVGINYKGMTYQAGWDSEKIRGGVQNFIHNYTNTPHFEQKPHLHPAQFYYYFGTVNPYSYY